MKRIHLYIVVLIIATSCQPHTTSSVATSWEELPIVAQRMETNGEPLIVCHWNKFSDSISLPLSYFVEDLEIVRLENKDEAYTRNTSVRVSENYILLHSSRNIPFKLFTRQGKFICNIGSVSSFPEGYKQICDFQLDEKHNRIYLMPWNTTKLLVYNLQGEQQASIPLNVPGEQPWSLPKSVFYVNGKLQQITVATLPWETHPRKVWVQDFHGNIIQEQLNTHNKLPKDYSQEIYHLNNTKEFEFSVANYYPEKQDSLYHYNIKNKQLTPVFTLSFNKNKILAHHYDELPDCFIGTVMGSMEMTGHTQTESRNHTNFIVDKHTLRGGRYHVYNDFLGNTEVFWLANSHNGYYARNLSPQMLMNELNEALQKNELTPAMQRKITALVESINTKKDNNYLMIGKLKKH